jgi:hypothetical protein
MPTVPPNQNIKAAKTNTLATIVPLKPKPETSKMIRAATAGPINANQATDQMQPDAIRSSFVVERVVGLLGI